MIAAGSTSGSITIEVVDDAMAENEESIVIAMDEATFRKMHEADRMANDKLDEGVKGFSKAIVIMTPNSQ